MLIDRPMGSIGQDRENRLNKRLLADPLFSFFLDRKGDPFGADDGGPTDMLMLTLAERKSEGSVPFHPFLTECGFSGPDIVHFVHLSGSDDLFLSHTTIIAATAAFSRGFALKSRKNMA